MTAIDFPALAARFPICNEARSNASHAAAH